MSVKQDILKILENNKGTYFSGEELASQFLVSRAAIWKAVKQLKEQGYKILAVQNKGYCLAIENDVLSEEGIRTELKEEYKQLPIIILKKTTSTNQEAKQAAVSGTEKEMIFLANYQSHGKGRRGRSFFSIDGKCIYLSILLKPKAKAEDLVLITTAASVAVYRAIIKITGFETQIKWVNDIYLRDKKICGILTEAVTGCESGIIESVVVGIGINFNIKSEKIPEELKDIIGALYFGDSKGITRNQLIAEIVNQLIPLSNELETHSFIEEYKKHSMILGHNILVIDGSKEKEAIAVDIDENGGLEVEYKDGTKQILHTGEVTIRKQLK